MMYHACMRTTINFDEEAEQLVAEHRRRTQLGLSETVNDLIKRAAAGPRADYVFPDVTFEMGARLPLESTSRLLEVLDGDAAR